MILDVAGSSPVIHPKNPAVIRGIFFVSQKRLVSTSRVGESEAPITFL